MGADPIRQRLAPTRLAVRKARCSQHRDKNLRKPHLARRGIGDAKLLAGIIDKHLVARPVLLAHDR